ncbi:PAS domain-containing protein [Shewanella violacea]|uniref:histidine kinase n=1 Tax=Shewanella violacea (strain JCM 10179 / CIP 106290 / LMG 19151 / DSS12) TaxID=637905 RepID=D4ZLD9_SHEVD|nr:PAS domain-containing protein [Shewanella violacea]BAJ02488.1 sensory box histidine kinase [Shewanella violacea DSS12]
MGNNGPDHQPSYKTHWLNSLPFKFSIIQFFIVGLIITSSIWLILSIEKKHHQETQLSLSQNLGLTIVAQLQQTTSKIEALAASMASIGVTYAHSPSQLQQIIPALLNTDGQQSLIAGGGIWPEPGAFDASKLRDSYFWSRDEQGHFDLVNGYNNASGSGYHSEIWYQPTRFFPVGTTYWSDAYIDPYTHEAMITASVPMWLEHQFIGVSTVDLALSSLKSFFNKLELHQAYLFALDSNNNLLAHPSDSEEQGSSPYLSHPFAQFTQDHPAYVSLLTEIDKIDAQFLKQAGSSITQDPSQLNVLLNSLDVSKRERLSALINANARQISSNSERTTSFVLDQDPLLKEPVLVSVFHMPRTYWKIILVTPLSEIGSKEHAIAAKIGIFLLLTQLIALVVLFIFQHRLFIKPISKMVESLQGGNIAKLELTANRRQDEIGKLAKAFISRSHQLEIAYASLDAGNLALEQQVAMQKHAQIKLSKHKNQLNSLLNSSQNLIYIKSTEGLYTLVNDRFCEVLGLERDKVIGAKDRDLFPVHIAEIIACHDKSIIDTQSPQSFEQVIPSNQGEITYLITGYPILDDEGNIFALGAMAFDISHIKTVNLELTSQIEEVNQSLVHQEMQVQQLHMTLRQLEQSSISIEKHQELFLQLQHSGAQNHKLMPQLITDILREQLKEHELIFTKLRQDSSLQREDDLLELIRLVTEQTDKLRHLLCLVVPQSEEIKSVHIKQFLEHLLAVLAPQLDAYKVEIKLNCSEALSLQVSPWSLLLLFYKLLQNTLTHGLSKDNEQNKITISVYKDQQQLLVCIKDNGVGIEPSRLEEINKQIREHTSSGTLSELALWLKIEFNGEISMSSERSKYTEVRCLLTIAD